MTFKPSYYALLYSMIRETGLAHGWAVAVHGSLAKDLDLICVAWIPDAIEAPELIKKIENKLSGTVFKYEFSGPHMMDAGREVWTLPIESDLYLDVTICDMRKRILEATKNSNPHPDGCFTEKGQSVYSSDCQGDGHYVCSHCGRFESTKEEP